MTVTGERQTPAPLRMQLADVLHHELRTPLTTVLGHAELLQDLDLAPSARSSVASILRAAERLQQFATSLTAVSASLNAAGPAWPVGDLTPHQCDLALVMADVVAARSPGQRPGDPEILSAAPARSVLAFVDEQAVRAALSALLAHAADRAVEAVDERFAGRPVVQIDTGVHGDVAVIEVRSPGPALPGGLGSGESVRYQEVALDLACVGESVLPLSLVDAVATAHGGSLWLAADADGRLVTRLELPRGLRLAA